jgi:8-oxo-dGTP pyrophosphatase MutT (NUDIX family)
MTNEAVARPAATVVLLRDSAGGLEVFMVVRHHAIDFAPGALVFPGGRVEEDDFTLARDTSLCPNAHGLDPEAMAFRLAAIRETFEECGVLFARPRRAEALIDGGALRAVEHGWRAQLAEGGIRFQTMLAENDLLPASDLLIHFAHWITPRHQPKRYDTHFFLASAPAEHFAVHDGTESVDSLWITPRQALADTAGGRFRLVFATQMNLMKLANFPTIDQAIGHARASSVVTVLPEVSPIDATRRLMRIPLEAGYGAAEFLVDNPPAS